MNPNPLLLIYGLDHLIQKFETLMISHILMSVTKHEHVFQGDVSDSIAVMFSLTQTDSLP